MRYFFSHYYPTSFSYGGGLKQGADLPSPGRAWVTEVTEGAAWYDLSLAAPSALDLRVERIGQAYVLLTPSIRHVLFNRVIGLGLVEAATESLVDRIIARYRSAGIDHFAIQLCTEADPTELPDWLTQRGLTREDAWVKLYRRPQRTIEQPAEPRVEEIAPDRAALFAQVATAAYGLPPMLQPWLAGSVGRIGWRHYLAYVDDQPVATAALFCRSGTAWLGIDSTLPEARRQGAQGALIARRVRDSGLLGCQWCGTETEADRPDERSTSLHNMLRAGFTPAYDRVNYIANA